MPDGPSMALSWHTAPTVAVGDVPTSSKRNALAECFNERLKSGIADPTWRIWYKAWSWMYKFFGADGPSVPAEDEWLALWMNVEQTSGYSIGGINLVNPLLTWIYGSTNGMTEAERIARVDVEIPASNKAAWELAKRQRGAYDPDTGAEYAPMTECPLSDFRCSTGSPAAPLR